MTDPTRGECGEIAAELVLAAPLLLALLVLVAVAGRVVLARGDVDAAARDAARAASLTRDPDAAERAARQAAAAALAGQSVCRRTAVAFEADGGFQPGGLVSVTVTCDVVLADLSPLPGLTARAVTARSSAVVDVYRGVSGGFGISGALSGLNGSVGGGE